jgi:hypothetical protein
MIISSLHLLLTYQCTFECDHCFVWGSPRQSGTMTLTAVRDILCQADALGTIQTIYFEGGEPFLYYPILWRAVEEATVQGFETGIVTNAYWATEVEDAMAWLRPLAALIQDLSVSSDLYHWDDVLDRHVRNAQEAADQLGIPIGTISVAQPDEGEATLASLMVRGRAVEKLASHVPHHPWSTFNECPYEDLRDPGRVHVDPLGHLHLCQGLTLGNLFRTPLVEICATYDPDAHPIVGPLLHGGPAELARHYDLTPEETYADACHLCYQTRLALRPRFPDTLTPDQMYGVFED